MSLILALSGIWVPVPGNVYPKKYTYSYRDVINKLGLVALAGAFVVLLFSWTVFIISIIFSLPPELTIWVDYAIKIGIIYSFLEIVLPFFPLRIL